jgi:DNA-binding response OmpR family regulator
MQAFVCSHQEEESASLKLVLQGAGFLVKSVHDPVDMIEQWPENSIDLVIISTDAVRERVIASVSQIRNQTNAAIFVIGELLREKQQIDLYNAGVDYVLQRPYSSALLIAQVKALMRRITGVPYFALPTLSLQGIELDPALRMVSFENKPSQRLTQLEFRLLYALMTHPGQILSPDSIVESVWGYSDNGNRDLVRGLVKRLRSKIEEDSKNPIHIKTMPGIGYFFE